MLSIVIFLPLAAAALLALPRPGARAAIWIWIAATAADLALVVAMWAGYGGGTAYEIRDLLGELDRLGLAVDRLSVHTPDLDDVFLALTGRSAPVEVLR